MILLKKVKTILGTASLVVSLMACNSNTTDPAQPAGDEGDRVKIIFETDMGNDIDDVIALDMLYKYVDAGKVDLLAVSNNKNSDYSIDFLKIMNRWYGHASIPLGNVVHPANSKGDSKDYAQAVCEYTIDGNRAFAKYLSDSVTVMPSVSLYRKILAAQPDSSVVMVSVGFSTNIAALLASGPDEYSPLPGRDLIAKKVRLLSMMAGSFNGDLRAGEYNVIKDSMAAKKLFDEWPVALVTSPFEVGIQVLYPAESIQRDLEWAVPHPAKIAYESYKPMPYDRPSWDPTAVLYAVEGTDGYFGISKPGHITVGANGGTTFNEVENGNHRYLTIDSAQALKVKTHFIEMVKKQPTDSTARH